MGHFLGLLSRLHFCFSFFKFNNKISWDKFLWGIQLVHSAAYICRLMSFAKFGEFEALFFSWTFQPIPLFPLFLDSDDMNVRYSVIIKQVPETPVFFQCIFLSEFRLDHFYCSVFQFTDFVVIILLLFLLLLFSSILPTHWAICFSYDISYFLYLGFQFYSFVSKRD